MAKKFTMDDFQKAYSKDKRLLNDIVRKEELADLIVRKADTGQWNQ